MKHDTLYSDSDVTFYTCVNRKSRATSVWTYCGSGGSVCRATCIFCRRVVSTCSAKWPKTVGFWERAAAHDYIACADRFFARLDRDEIAGALAYIRHPITQFRFLERVRIAHLESA